LKRSIVGSQYGRRNVCFWHKADIQLSSANVRFWGKADIVISERHVCF
jgi:hypothetical protein